MGEKTASSSAEEEPEESGTGTSSSSLCETGKKMGYRYRTFFFLLLLWRKEVNPLLPPSADEKGGSSLCRLPGWSKIRVEA